MGTAAFAKGAVSSLQGIDLRSAVLLSILSVWVMVGVYHYLNRHTKRYYFSLWTLAWLFYSLWLTSSYSQIGIPPMPWMRMFSFFCLATAATFLLWGSSEFLGVQTSRRMWGLFLFFLYVWAWAGEIYVQGGIWQQAPVFFLMAGCSLAVSRCYFRQRKIWVGAGLLAFGFVCWSLYMGWYPWAAATAEFRTSVYFISAVIQLFIALSMVVLVLEETRRAAEIARAALKQEKSTTGILQAQVSCLEESYHSLFQQASEGILIIDPISQKILNANPAAQRIFGGHQLLSCGFPQLLSADRQPLCCQQILDTLSANPKVTFVRPSAQEAMLELGGCKVKYHDEWCFQVFVRDITEKEQLQRQMAQTEKLSALGQMISGVAHELNNPLAVVRGYFDLALIRARGRDAEEEEIRIALSECERAIQLVQDFLAFARKQPLRRHQTDINKLVQRVVSLCTKGEIDAQVRWETQLDPQLPRTIVDPHQIQMVLVNVVTNALQATENRSQRRIRVATSCHRNEEAKELIRIEISDSGPGIPEQLLPRIFEPFFTTKEVGKGTGLGLSIVSSIILTHDGQIGYKEAAGGGACFVIDLPVLQGPEAVCVQKRKLEADIRGLSIIVLDDEKPLADVTTMLLGSCGCKVTTLYEPRSALEMLTAQDFDLVISDFRMPGLDGITFFEEVVRRRPDLKDKVIFITGDTTSEGTARFFRDNAIKYLQKPFTLPALTAIVASAARDRLEAGDVADTAKQLVALS